MKRLVLFATASWLILASVGTDGQADPSQSRPPNIVVIVSDDMGYADIGVHGSKDIPTPNIDALAKNGIRFTDAYVTGPYCSPTRAGFLTGRYPQRFGHEFNVAVGPQGVGRGLPLGQITLADRLKAAGYRTAIFGKWHLGADEAFHPQSRGFDEFYGFLGGQHSYMDVGAESVNPILDGRKPAAAVTYLTHEIADRSSDFIRRHRRQPFFLYVAFNAVHTPMHAAAEDLARFAGIKDERRRAYAAMLSAMDAGIGKTMAALVEERLLENTLVIYFNDNGGPTMGGTTMNGSSNAPLRGSKRQTWEGGIRVPFMIQWTGRLSAGRVDSRPVIQLDVMPTALSAAGIDVSPAWKLDGVNLLPFLTDKSSARPHDELYWRLGEHMAIRKGDWKLVKTSEGPLRAIEPGAAFDLTGAGLYNLAKDIGESKNLSASEPEKVKELGDAWRRWNNELATPLWGPGRGGPPEVRSTKFEVRKRR